MVIMVIAGGDWQIELIKKAKYYLILKYLSLKVDKYLVMILM